MNDSRNCTFIFFLLFGVSTIFLSGCGGPIRNVQDLLKEPVQSTGKYHHSKKYRKAGITVVYLTGTPYEIGYAHGKLCKNEIVNVNKIYWDYYDHLKKLPDGKWLSISHDLERYIPEEYIIEMKGIADGSGIEYDKILFLNTLSTISMHGNCFAFSFRQAGSQIITVRQADINTKSQLYKKMILYMIKPQKGYGFAAILNPGWVSGETGMNEHGITVSENNIKINQTEWDVMPINFLSRTALQYSKSIDDVGRFLGGLKVYPSRLLFVSSNKSASIFELANREMARIKMKDGYLAMANHAYTIPSKNITYHSVKRLDLGNSFLKENLDDLNIEKAIELARTSRITWYWNPTVHNRQSIIFSPATLDYWIAIPSDSNYTPASYGPYVGFNLKHELYGSSDEPNPRFFPGY